ncbi:ubiquitin carboxyl-terminal hydrolase 1 [Corchorus capsularis]|uniref:Ubiquitin carboxyl-terminal hydrolase 1 n=1 Tax=Corchorus capsularis TaxID=210143 RepID=A0A1R3G2I7_COCAP|nr:ubiquitin carboxyl-terminal hydrolase 1 [Corchorus capsularis]
MVKPWKKRRTGLVKEKKKGTKKKERKNNSTVAGSSLPPAQKQPAVVTEFQMVDSQREELEKPATVEGTAKGSGPAKPGQSDPKCVQQTTGDDVVMEEASNEESSKIDKGSKEETGAGAVQGSLFWMNRCIQRRNF